MKAKVNKHYELNISRTSKEDIEKKNELWGWISMLSIYTSKDIAREYSKKDIVPDIDKRFLLRLTDANKDTLYNDRISTEILETIEGMTERKENGYITAKFGDVQLRDISTGGKSIIIISN